MKYTKIDIINEKYNMFQIETKNEAKSIDEMKR